MLEYKIEARDTNLRQMIPDNHMIIYTNDTIVRTENFTSSLGQQVVIKHMDKNKSYLLLKTQFGKYAIPTDHSEESKENVAVKTESKYTFKKKFFKRKVLGMKCKRLIVSHPGFEEPIEFLYLKNISNRYNLTFEEIPGLPVKYSIVTADGVIDYSLTKKSDFSPNRDLFGIPSEYEKITFDEFLDKMLSIKEESNNSPE